MKPHLAAHTIIAWCLFFQTACLTRTQIDSGVRQAMSQDALPKVVACYEDAYERNGFSGEFIARVDFTIESGTGALQDVAVQSIAPLPSGGHTTTDVDEAFRACLPKALASTRVKPLSSLSTVHVTNYPIAFKAPRASELKDGKAHGGAILVGPRDDRCRGLYSYRPPRDAAALYTQLGQLKAELSRVKAGAADQRARTLQQSYDVMLELRLRLRMATKRKELKAGSRRRMREAIITLTDSLNQTGNQIGCTPPN